MIERDSKSHLKRYSILFGTSTSCYISLLENLGVSESIGCLLGKLLLGVGKRPDVLPRKKSQDKINFAKVSSHTVLSYEAVLDAILYRATCKV